MLRKFQITYTYTHIPAFSVQLILSGAIIQSFSSYVNYNLY